MSAASQPIPTLAWFDIDDPAYDGGKALGGIGYEAFLAEGDPKQERAMVLARLRYLSAHEVGHTLGLMHNWAATTFGWGSVMDYLPANLAPKGTKQGDYFTTTIGPYDYWAIEYAYKPIDGKEEDALRFRRRERGNRRDGGRHLGGGNRP